MCVFVAFDACAWAPFCWSHLSWLLKNSSVAVKLVFDTVRLNAGLADVVTGINGGFLRNDVTSCSNSYPYQNCWTELYLWCTRIQVFLRAPYSIIFTLPAGVAAEYCDEHVCVCVLSVCLQTYLQSHVRDLYQIFCACCLWPLLGPPLAEWRNPTDKVL